MSYRRIPSLSSEQLTSPRQLASRPAAARCVSSLPSPSPSVGSSTSSLISVLDHESLLDCLDSSLCDDDDDDDDVNDDSPMRRRSEGNGRGQAEDEEDEEEEGDDGQTRVMINKNGHKVNSNWLVESNDLPVPRLATVNLSQGTIGNGKRTQAPLVKTARTKSAPSYRDTDRGQVTGKKTLPRPRTAKQSSEKAYSVTDGETLHLTAWERWMLRKAEEERRSDAEQAKRNMEKEAKEKKEEEQRRLKQQRTQQELANWCLRKKLESELKRGASVVRAAAATASGAAQRRDGERRADVNFRAWLQRKHAATAAATEARAARADRQRTEKEARREACSAEFDRWCQVKSHAERSADSGAARRSKSVTHGTKSYGLVNYAVPSFFNPIPWQANAIPRVKPDRKISRSKYQWRPTQYA